MFIFIFIYVVYASYVCITLALYPFSYLGLIIYRYATGMGELIVNANALIMNSFLPVIQDND